VDAGGPVLARSGQLTARGPTVPPTPDATPPADPADLWQQWLRAFGGTWPSPPFGVKYDNAQDIFGGAQVGLINITQGKSRNPGLEQRIVTEVAGYGRQIGRLLEAVDVLARHRPKHLSDEDGDALDDLHDLAKQIAAFRRQAARDDADRIVADVALLCENPIRNADVLRRLRDQLDGPPGGELTT
jgi:hypothetical protein